MSDVYLNPHFLEHGLFVAYMIYHATGEGVRISVSVAGSAYRADASLRKKIDKYFHPAIRCVPLDDTMPEEVTSLMKWIPLPVQSTLSQIYAGAGEYYFELFYNIA